MKKNFLVVFFILTFILTWSMWLPAALTQLGGGTSILGPDGVGQFGRWAPGIVAIILTGIAAGKQGVGALFRPLKIWRVHLGWYLFALLFQPALFLISKWIDVSLLGRTYEIISPLASVTIEAPFIFIAVGVIISAIPGAFMEELGWRGFALPRLQNKNTALVAGIILGLIWGGWHIPSMLYFGETNGLTIGLAVLNTIPLAILFTWLFNNTQGSLLLVTLFHASLQYSNNFLGTIPGGTADIITWLVAMIVLISTGVNHLSRSNERIQSD